MTLHDAVYDGPQLVLAAGKTLNSADVDFLRNHRPGASVSVEDPILDEIIAFHDERGDNALAQETQSKLATVISDVQEQYCSRITRASLDCQSIKNTVGGVLNYLGEKPVLAAKLCDMDREHGYLVAHSAHVFYLSIVLGNAVRSRVRDARRKSRAQSTLHGKSDLDLTPLALAALFMDTGMAPLADLYNQKEPLTLEQCEMIRNHPTVSAQALPEDAPELTKLLIETHHENHDGSGYPYGLKGDEIHVYARILRVADAYAAATSRQVYKEACSSVRALWEMTWGMFAHFYDPVILKIFASVIQPYPIGGVVRLNSQFGAVVVRYGRVSPFLPDIVIAFDEEGRRLPKDKLVGPIRLDAHPTLKIVEFLGEDLSELYDRDTRVEKVSNAEFTTLYEGVVSGCATATRG